MTEIRFYHLQTKTLEQALPELLAKGLAAGHRIVVRCADKAQVESLNDHLWTYKPDSFLPHGSGKDLYQDQQPVWLTDGTDNPNQAGMLVLAGGPDDELSAFTLCCDIFDGQNETALSEARVRWKNRGSEGHAVTYWQQTEKGWEKKA